MRFFQELGVIPSILDMVVATDNCNMVYSQSNATVTYPQNINTTVSVIDAGGNTGNIITIIIFILSASCMSIISFVDNTDPLIECIDTVIVNENVMPDLTTMINCIDNCRIQSITQNITINSTISQKNNTVLVIVTDSSGNM